MQKRTFDKTKKRCMNTIEALCKLKMDYFYIGYSAGRAAYVGLPGRKDWCHAVVLADKMECDDALDLEEAIHNSISDTKHLLKKYHPEKIKDGRITIRKNYGGHRPKGAQCSVYMLW